MNSEKTGGPAFPGFFMEPRELGAHTIMNPDNPRPFKKPPEGMFPRDYFAAKAMQGLLCDISEYDERCLAKAAYELADAMLKARDE